MRLIDLARSAHREGHARQGVRAVGSDSLQVAATLRQVEFEDFTSVARMTGICMSSLAVLFSLIIGCTACMSAFAAQRM
eukprot:6458565-Amphidinium_carterae.1